MSRRWAPPKPRPPQQELFLSQRGRFTPAVKIPTDTSDAAAASLGLKRRGDSPAAVGQVASAMVGVLERHAARVRLGGVMLALDVRREVYDYLRDRPDGATADEIAYALGYSILTVRPRVSELNRMQKIADSGARRKNASGRNAIVWRVRDGGD